MAADEMITIGWTGKAHGLKGEVRLYPAARYEALVHRIGRLFLVGEDGLPRERTVEAVRRHHEVFLIKLSGADDRSAAETLEKMRVTVRRADLESAGWEGAFPEDLEGMEVVTAQGAVVGVVERVEEYPAGEMYEVRTGGRSILVPAVPPILVEIDLEKRRIVIAPPEGLLELNS